MPWIEIEIEIEIEIGIPIPISGMTHLLSTWLPG